MKVGCLSWSPLMHTGKDGVLGQGLGPGDQGTLLGMGPGNKGLWVWVLEIWWVGFGGQGVMVEVRRLGGWGLGCQEACGGGDLTPPGTWASGVAGWDQSWRHSLAGAAPVFCCSPAGRDGAVDRNGPAFPIRTDKQ